LRRGITIDGVRYGPVEARLDREQGGNIWLSFAMREGKNREVKNVLGHLGLAVNRLIRVSFGPFQLGDLAEGAVEEVRTRHLREQFGEKLATAAGLDFTAPVVPLPQDRASEPGSPASIAAPRSRAEGGPVAPHKSRGVGDSQQTPFVRGRPPTRSRPVEQAAMPSPRKRGEGAATSGLRAFAGSTPRGRHKKDKKPQRVPEHVGEPERARRERKRGRRPFRGKPR
jgi:23S rRNA pseudouridine2605 synthase